MIHLEIFTNNTGLTYTVTGIWTTPDGNTSVVAPALTYLNNPIQDCEVPSVQIEIESTGRSTTQLGWSPWGETLQVRCSWDAEINTNFLSRLLFVVSKATTERPLSGLHQDTI